MTITVTDYQFDLIQTVIRESIRQIREQAQAEYDYRTINSFEYKDAIAYSNKLIELLKVLDGSQN